MKGITGGVSLCAGAAFFLAAPLANAFCGFYVSGADAKLFNDATQVASMREGTRTVLAMQNDYQGPPERFAMVVPVPVILQKENVKTLPRAIFEHLSDGCLYAIRHAWGGPIECKNPVRGRWGGPPGKGYGYEPPKPALNVAFAARDVALPSFVRSEIPELGIKGEGVAPAPAMPAVPADPVTTAPSAAPTIPPAGSSIPFGEPEAKKGGCFGCALSERQEPNGALVLLGGIGAMLGIFGLRRRRAT